MGLIPKVKKVIPLKNHLFVRRSLMYNDGYTILDREIKKVYIDNFTGQEVTIVKEYFIAYKINYELLAKVLKEKARRNEKTQ